MTLYYLKMTTCSDCVDIHNLNKPGCRVLHYINMLWSLYNYVHAFNWRKLHYCYNMYMYESEMVEAVHMAFEELLIVRACT